MRRSTSLKLSAGAMAVAIATLGTAVPTFGADPSQPTLSAQVSLVGQCRAVNKKVSVFKQAATTSAVVSTLNADTKVTLADNGSGGFIGISSPVSGYLQTANLKPCTGTTPPTGNTCRRVIQPLGLAIRREASPDSAPIGGIAYLDRLDLTTTPATSKKGADGRNWIQIAKPAAGWVSNGFPGGNSNLGLCP
ncbi:MAG: SH3 domain-containing protein [Lyngbya sp. HA4199-MV5]|nr:SH3 domain-containing protein [Lyngbya sp. HA4199-MV5]